MKGRANYACRQKIYDAEKEPVLQGLEEIADFRDHPRSGKRPPRRATAPRSRPCPRTAPPGRKIDARADLCTGQKCPQFERCFITLMHQRAQESDIIIVNHHLFFADLAVKGDERGAIIPDYARGDFRRSARDGGRRGAVFRSIRFELPVRGAGARRDGAWRTARSLGRRSWTGR